jgi:hypothetical protein
MGITEINPTGFIVPDEHENVRNWTFTNQLNQDLLDRLIGNPDLQAYAAVLGSVQGTTPPNIGDAGSVSGLWIKIFGIVYAYVLVQFGGAGIDPGSGNNYFTISLPVAAHPELVELLHPGESSWASRSPAIGSAFLRDSSAVSTNAQTALVQLRTAQTAVLITERSITSRVVDGENPFVWNTNDRISAFMEYRGVDG